MRISSRDEYLQIEPSADPELLPLPDPRFPYAIVVECDFPEWAVAERWCWQQFGPRHGKCWAQPEYATCPLILATEHVVRTVVRGKQYQLTRYSPVKAHCHVGTWKADWIDKTDYDHGYGEFCFSIQHDLRRFLEYIPQVDWGENYPWLREERG